MLGLLASGGLAAPPSDLARRIAAIGQRGTATQSAASAAATRPAVSVPPAESPAAFDAWYQEQLQQVPPTDVDRMYNLALACWTGKHPEQAADACRRILATWPSHARAKTLLRASNQLLAAHSAGRTPASQSAASRPVASRPTRGTVAAVLTPEAINRLRFEEFCFKDMDDRPRVVIPPSVIQEFLAEVDKTQAMTAQEKAQFQQSGNDDKLRWIVLHTGDRFAERIHLNSEPRSLTTYRQKVWPIISKGCGLPACHGGDGGGPLRLMLPISLPAAGASNFYILNTFESDDGRVIDRLHPEASLLLQYGLPAEQALARHPAAIKPLYSGTNDVKYRIVLEWIQALRTPPPDYRFAQNMWQRLTPATAPARTAASQATKQAVSR